jgi:hypothetical protein
MIGSKGKVLDFRVRASAVQQRRGRAAAALCAGVLAALALTATASRGDVAGACFCDDRGGIAISQLVSAVNVALERFSCPPIPSRSGETLAGRCFCSENGRLAIPQLIRAVNIALGLQFCPVGAFVGPAGGSIAVTDPHSPLAGVKVNVPAGAVSGANITLTARTDSDLPLPPGLAGLGYGFDLATDEALASEIEICFPVYSSQRRYDQILSGLYLDATAARWDVAQPASVGSHVFTVRTRKVGTWRPGVTLVGEADEALTDSIELIHGPQVIAQFKEGVRGFVEPFLDRIASIDTWTNCSNVTTLLADLTRLRGLARALDLSDVAPQCGTCNVSLSQFREDIGELISIKVESYVTDNLLQLVDLPFWADVATQLLTLTYYQNKVEALSCDYECLVEANPTGLWLNVGTAVAAEVVVDLAEYLASEKFECP